MKHAPHCVGIASAQSGLRCTVSSVILMRRCGGGCIHNPSEGVKPPAAWLRAEHRRSAHAIRCTTDFCSSRRNVRGTLASYSSLRDERYLPRGRPEHPVPAHQDEPCEHCCDAAGRIRTRALFSDLRRFHVKPAHSPQEVHHTCPFSPAVHVVTIGFAVLPNARHSISTCQSSRIFHTLPSQHKAFHPIGRDVLDGRPPVST